MHSKVSTRNILSKKGKAEKGKLRAKQRKRAKTRRNKEERLWEHSKGKEQEQTHTHMQAKGVTPFLRKNKMKSV